MNLRLLDEGEGFMGEQKMRVLYITSDMLPWEVHGVTVHLKYLAECMSKKADVTVLYTCPNQQTGENIGYELQNGVRVLTIPNVISKLNLNFASNTPNGWIKASFPLTQCWKSVEELLEHEKFDIVHFQDYYAAFAIEAVKSKTKAKIVTTIHALSRKDQHISAGIRQWLITNSDAVISVSQWASQYISQRFNLFNAQLKTIYNGTAMRYVKSDKRDLITFSGRLETKKGCDILLQALAKIGKETIQSKGLSVLIMGDGSEKERLQDMAYSLGLSEVCTFMGQLHQSQVEAYLSRSLVHAVPSREEVFGLSSIEAMAKGAYTIVSSVDGLPESVVEKHLGCIIENEDVNGLSEAILQHINNPLCEEKRSQYARIVSERFSWEYVADETYKLYLELIKSI